MHYSEIWYSEHRFNSTKFIGGRIELRLQPHISLHTSIASTVHTKWTNNGHNNTHTGMKFYSPLHSMADVEVFGDYRFSCNIDSRYLPIWTKGSLGAQRCAHNEQYRKKRRKKNELSNANYGLWPHTIRQQQRRRIKIRRKSKKRRCASAIFYCFTNKNRRDRKNKRCT